MAIYGEIIEHERLQIERGSSIGSNTQQSDLKSLS